MVVGGSSGAVAINKAVREALPKLTESFQVLHICGAGHLSEPHEGAKNYCQREYLNDELPHAYQMADVIVSRAGANALCEILALRKPALLIPYPKAASRGDQLANAAAFEKRGCAACFCRKTFRQKRSASRWWICIATVVCSSSAWSTRRCPMVLKMQSMPSKKPPKRNTIVKNQIFPEQIRAFA